MSECEKCTDSYYYKRYKIVQAENKEQAEQIQLLEYNLKCSEQATKNIAKDFDDRTDEILKQDAENKRLKELVEAKDELLVCYRLGRRHTEKLMKKLDRLKAAPPQKGE